MSDLPLPQGWKRTTLGKLAKKLVNGGTPPTGEARYWNGKIPWITGADFTSSGLSEFRRFVSEQAASETATNVIERGQLLIVTRTGVGKLAIAPCDVAISQDITGFYVDQEQAETEFLYHRMRQGVEDLKKLNQGTSINGIVRGDLIKYEVNLPAPKQQRRIAQILTTVDEAMEQTEALVGKLEQMKAGLMHDLFTRGVTPDAHLRPTRQQAPHLYHETPLGWLPKEWRAELLDNLSERGSGHTPNRHRPDFWNGGIKWVSLADSWRLDRLYISETDKEISSAGIANSSAVLHPPGIVVLSRDAGVGKSAITTSSMAVSQHFMCWRCGPNLDNHFLYYWLQSQKRIFENIATGTTIPTIGLRFFKHYRIAAPVDVKEQQRIGSILRSADAKLFALEDDLAKLRQQKQGLMQDLLTGRVLVG